MRFTYASCIIRALLLCPALIATSLQAQQGVAINSSGANPDPSAVLDVSSDTRGLLIPRVNLTSTASASPVSSPAPSLLVYNLAEVNDVTPGFYFWTGSAWSPLSGGSSDLWSKTGDNLHPTVLTDDVAIGTSAPEATASLDISSTTKGLLIPRMTSVQRDAITSPATGLQVFNLDCNAVDYWNGTCWLSMAPPLPHPGAITAAGTIFCSGTTQTFSVAAVTGATEYTWSLPPGATITSGQGTNSVTVTMGSLAGQVCVVASNECSSSPQSCLPISVNTAPSAPGLISGPTTVARGTAPATYSISPVAGATTYTWTVPSGASIVSGAGTSTVSVSFPCSSTTGSLSVSASNSCGASAGSASVNVTLTPIANAGPPAFGGSVLGGNTAFPTGSGGTGALSYSWTPTVDLSAYNGTNPSASCTGTTNTYTVTVTDAIGCTATSSVLVTRNQPLIVNAGGTQTITAGTTATLGGSPTVPNGAGLTYSWSPATGLSATNVPNPIANPGSTTTYTLNVTGSCGSSGSATATVNVSGTQQVFNFTGTANVPWVVPPGVTTIKIEAFGAQGGGSSGTASGGGLGGYATVIRNVTPGETLFINVGGQGANGSSQTSAANFAALNTQGFNGGAPGRWASSAVWSGGGGGASDVRQGGTALSNRIIVAGGGGSQSSIPVAGGGGGFPNGTNGTLHSGNGGAGGGGTQTSGGSAGSGASPGTLGTGGQGALMSGPGAGGSGGGGLWGGGGGGNTGCGPCTGGAGGGSSYYDGISGTATPTGVRTGNGQIIITY